MATCSGAIDRIIDVRVRDGGSERMQELVGAKARSREHPKAQRHFVRPAVDAVVDEVTEDSA